jgi:hypothetical protein
VKTLPNSVCANPKADFKCLNSILHWLLFLLSKPPSLSSELYGNVLPQFILAPHSLALIYFSACFQKFSRVKDLFHAPIYKPPMGSHVLGLNSKILSHSPTFCVTWLLPFTNNMSLLSPTFLHVLLSLPATHPYTSYPGCLQCSFTLLAKMSDHTHRSLLLPSCLNEGPSHIS